jgi:hypothetical protein
LPNFPVMLQINTPRIHKSRRDQGNQRIHETSKPDNVPLASRDIMGETHRK